MPPIRPRVDPFPHALIDLHLHTTASDGRLAPAALVKARCVATLQEAFDRFLASGQPAVMAAPVGAGLDAIEVYHSDFHGDDSRDRPLGRTTLPSAEFERLCAAARRG